MGILFRYLPAYLLLVFLLNSEKRIRYAPAPVINLQPGISLDQNPGKRAVEEELQFSAIQPPRHVVGFPSGRKLVFG
jgi:hypothetical protein